MPEKEMSAEVKISEKFKVSVIIPVYNARNYIGQAIESALNQTHKNLEILVINDGSSDDSEDIIKKYTGLDPRIRYFSHDNKGVSLTRNSGIEKASGEFIAFLDADDAWEPENIETKIDILINDPQVDWVFSDMYLADESLNKTEVIEGGNDGDLLNSLLSRKGEAIHAPSNIVVRAECLKKHTIRFDPKLSTSADWDFCIQLASHQLRGKRVARPLWSYRVLENSMSRNLQIIENDNLYVHRKAKSQKLFSSFWHKQLCFSNNYLILAGIWWVNGNKKLRSIYYIIKAILFYPPNISKILVKFKKFNFYQAKRTPIPGRGNFIRKNSSSKTVKPLNKKHITTFLFHRINPTFDPLWNPIHPDQFEQIIVYLNKHFEFIQLTEYLLGDVTPKTNKPLCAIGFDDGYRDFLEYAEPILKKYNCPSSMYIVTDCIERNLPPWTYMLNHYFINTGKYSMQINTEDFPGHLKNTSWKNKPERLLYAKQLNPYLKSLNNSVRETIYKEIISELDDVSPPHGLMLTWEEVKKLKEHNCEVGSHTMYHPMLSKKLTHTRLMEELRESGNVILEHTGQFPKTISYPFGAYDENVKKAAMEAGYKIGVTVNPGSFDSSRHDLFEIPRIELFDEPFLKTKLRINEIAPTIRKILTLQK